MLSKCKPCIIPEHYYLLMFQVFVIPSNKIQSFHINTTEISKK